jgi:peptidoglycan/LPS O-acetylase OafA/YrhL
MTMGAASGEGRTATPDGSIRRPALDGLRGLAVLLVLLCHTWVPLVAQAGSVGVTLFFVLSGFLITRLLLAERARTGTVSYCRFYARRARRLLPALVVLLAAVAAYLVASHQSLLPVVLAAAYSANLANMTGHSLGNLDHLWSLSLEEQFYFVWPVLLPFLARHRRPLVLLATAVAAVVTLRTGLWLTGAPVARIYYGADTRADALLVGCGLAFLGPEVAAHRWLRPAAQGGAVILAATCVMPDASLAWVLIPLPFACAAVILWAEQHPGRLVTCRPLVLTGRISYGLYLWNLPVALTLRSWDQDIWAKGVVLVAVSFLLAGLSWFVIERPFIRRPAVEARGPVRPTRTSDRQRAELAVQGAHQHDGAQSVQELVGLVLDAGAVVGRRIARARTVHTVGEGGAALAGRDVRAVLAVGGDEGAVHAEHAMSGPTRPRSQWSAPRPFV